MRTGIDCFGRQWEENSKLLSPEKDLTSQTFGSLTVLFRVQNDSQGNSYWLTSCKCGNELVVKGVSLRNGHTSSCGCTKREIISEKLTRSFSIGEQVGNWTIMYKAPGFLGKGAHWHCMCKCGTEKNVSGESLRTGTSTSCGCMNKKQLSEMFLIDLTGRRFGALTVLGVTNKRSGRDRYWTVLCDCGNIKDVSGHSLRRGDVASCGCQSMSAGETIISNLLKNNNIAFETEYVFSDLLSDAGFYLRFDFAIFNNDGTLDRLVEYDGRQHTVPIDFFGGTEYFDKLHYHDTLKNQYALSHNIPLVRIPYYERNALSVDDILGNKYLITI